MRAKKTNPIVPMLPLLNLDDWHWHSDNSTSAFLTDNCFLTHGARYAMLSGIQAMGIKAGDHVLLPGYHCFSMVAPFVWYGCTVEYYKVTRDLRIDYEDLLSRLRRQTKAILLTHFFAMPQTIEPVLEIANKQGILLIEDCAHAFFGHASGQRFGTIGHFSVASGKKFFPIDDGGILKFNRAPISAVDLNQNHASQNLKQLVNSLEVCHQYGRLRPLSSIVSFLTTTKDSISTKLIDSPNQPHTKIVNVTPEHTYIDAALVGQAGRAWSRWLMRHTEVNALRQKRRHNFNYLLVRLGRMRNARPLFEKLPDESTPYVFPLLLDSPREQFPLLKKAGVPMWRWEDVQPSHCHISRDYRDRLIQLPCHQSIWPAEMDTLADALAATLD